MGEAANGEGEKRPNTKQIQIEDSRNGKAHLEQASDRALSRAIPSQHGHVEEGGKGEEETTWRNGGREEEERGTTGGSGTVPDAFGPLRGAVHEALTPPPFFGRQRRQTLVNRIERNNRLRRPHANAQHEGLSLLAGSHAAA
eukprot:1639529-Pleurochrysis_carterae.AAC.2